MEKLYKELKDGEVRINIQRLSDSAFISLDPANADYAAFLELVKEHGEEKVLVRAEPPQPPQKSEDQLAWEKEKGVPAWGRLLAKRLGLE
jgi:hypothetical protein